MASLKFKTRLDSHPQGKPKVYFCCHDDDFEYFEEITKDIFEYSDCSIWYFDSMEEDYLDSLKQMQLFVMPVTTKLLTTKNRAIDVEFKFALDNHIPVLPLMKETGLEELFNKVCGEIQFLDKRKKEKSGISYKDKLQKHLSSVLVGDELANKIRAAFDAYVFLSYRKKDRKQAEELMKLIHKDPLCRDIAIWYDEFLVPGENFNDSIKQALQNSDVFVMAVTPNLVNENNYIINVEYPMARQENKPIVPVELIPTDREMANIVFSELPVIINASDEELTNRMMKEIKRVAVESNNTPEHNFFIGLAYLSGIDVEVDSKKAFDLISEAADSGLIEAINKMYDIYKNGIGTKYNYQEALKWLKKKIDVLEKRNEDNEELFDTYLKCGEMLVDFLNYNEALVYYTKAEKMNISNKDKYINLYLQIGTIYENEYDIDKANTYYNRSLEISLELERTTTNNVIIANCYHKIGKGLYKTFKYNEALESYKLGYEIYKKIPVGEMTEEIQLDLSTLLKSIGSLYSTMNDSVNALEYLEKAYEIGHKLIYSLNGIEYADEFIATNLSLGNLFFKDKLYEEAEHYYESVRMTTAGLIENKGTFDIIITHIKSLNRIGHLYYQTNRKQNAIETYQEALEKSKRLVTLTDVLCVNRVLCDCYLNIGYFYTHTDEYDKALDNFDKAYKIINLMLEKNDSDDIKYDLNIYYDNMVMYHYRRKEYNVALEYHMKQNELHNWFLENDSQSITVQRNASLFYTKIANCYYKIGNIDEAEKYYDKSLKIKEELYNKTKANQQIFDYAEMLYYMGTWSEFYKKTNEAIEYYNNAIRLLEDLLKKQEINSARKLLVKYYDRLIGRYNKNNNFICAEEAIDKRLYHKRYVEKRENCSEKLNFVYSYNRIGYVEYIKGNYKTSISSYKCAIFYLLDIDDYEKIGYIDFLTKILNKISEVYSKLGVVTEYKKYKDLAKLSNENIYDVSLQKELNEIYLESCDMLGKHLKSKMISKDAIEYFKKAIIKRENMLLDFEKKCELADNFNMLADIYFSHLSDFSNSLTYNCKEFDLRSEIVREKYCADLLHKLSIPCSYIARCYKFLGDLEKCEEYLFKYLDIKNEIYSISKKEESISGLAYAYTCLSEFYEEKLHNYEKAIKYKKEEIKYLEEVVEIDNCDYNIDELERSKRKLNELLEK